MSRFQIRKRLATLLSGIHQKKEDDKAECSATKPPSDSEVMSQIVENDFELIAGLEIQHCCVCLTDQQVAIPLHGRGVAELPTTFADASTTIKGNTLGVQQSLIESSEVQAIGILQACGVGIC